MNTTTTFVPSAPQASALFVALSKKASELWIASAWASDGTSVARALWEARDRVSALAVGLDFHRTDPEFLRRFRTIARVRESVDGTFHPKVYVFREGSFFHALVGSSNFTRGGFETNAEANVYIQGPTKHPLFQQMTDYVTGLADDGRIMSPAALAHYDEQFRARLPARRHAASLTPRRPSRLESSLDVKWANYVSLLRRASKRSGHLLEPHGADLGYVGVIRHVQQIFGAKRRLSAMTPEERQQVAGLVKPFLYFGSMRGAGYFKALVNGAPGKLDRALDHIPAEGPVLEPQFDAFVQNIAQHPGMGRPAVGTRLLAMKRPDQFLCLDGANRRSLGAAFGFSVNRLNSYEGYWDLLQILWASPWYRAPRPRGNELELWKARVALVDAVFYERR